MDTNGMDTNALATVGADVVLSVVAGRDRMVTAGPAGENPSSGAISARGGQANDAINSSLRTPVRRAIIEVIAHLLAAEIPAEIPQTETRP